jgi:drug/metabolite transporter (DMT)-like permease
VLLAILAIRPARKLDGRTTLVTIAAGIALAVHFATWIASLQYTSVAISVLLVSLAPLWNVAYDTVIARKPLRASSALALAAGFAGLTLVMLQRDAPAPIPHEAALGAALAIAGSVAFAAYLILVRPAVAAVGTRSVVTVTYGVAAAALALAALVAHQHPPPLGAHAAWAGIIAMALLSQLLGHTGMNASLRWFSSTTVSFSTLLEPLIAAVAAWVLFGERLSAAAVLGGALILTALALAIWTAPKPALD